MYQDAPPLEGWWTLPQAAAHLKISRQAVHQMAKTNKFTTLHRLGDQERPIYVIRSSEILAMVKERESFQHELLADNE